MNIRNDFPFLEQKVNGYPIAYLDNAATTHKPQAVLDALMHFYKTTNANVHRAPYAHAESATKLYEDARTTVAHFIGGDRTEIIFTRGATEGINLIAHAWALPLLKAGDEIVITELEHHANILPWRYVAAQTGALVKVIPIQADGTINVSSCAALITTRTKLVSVVHTSHITGAHLPIEEIARLAHAVGAYILVDAAQSVAHQKIDVKKLKVDFLVFSAHKLCGPTGIGALFAARHTHDQLNAYQWGGGMVAEIQATGHVSVQRVPHRLEAGTPAIAQAIGFAAAVRYINNFDRNALQEHEALLCRRFIEGVKKMPKIHLVGPLEELSLTGHLISFWIDGIHAHDVSSYLDQYGIAVRAGNLCAQPLIRALGDRPLVRVSFFFYTTFSDVDRLLVGLECLLRDFCVQTK